MMESKGFEKNTSRQKEQVDYEKLIWVKAEELGDLEKEIQAHLESLEEKISARPFRSLNLHKREERAEDEKVYWQLQAELRKLQEDENRLQQYLEDLERGVVDDELIKGFLSQVRESQDETRISKRKKRILEERERSGVDPRNVDSELGLGANPSSLSTGRHLKRVKTGGHDDPVGAFYYYTTDTHGGKVGHGKDGRTYVSKSGKRIRKR